MLCTLKTKQQSHTYHLLERSETFEGETITQFGITQVYYDDSGHQIVTSIPNISDDYQIVFGLIERLEGEDVDPITLEYIVEDYLVELFEV